jgi:hypothetical protein
MRRRANVLRSAHVLPSPLIHAKVCPLPRFAATSAKRKVRVFRIFRVSTSHITQPAYEEEEKLLPPAPNLAKWARQEPMRAPSLPNEKEPLSSTSYSTPPAPNFRKWAPNSKHPLPTSIRNKHSERAEQRQQISAVPNSRHRKPDTFQRPSVPLSPRSSHSRPRSPAPLPLSESETHSPSTFFEIADAMSEIMVDVEDVKKPHRPHRARFQSRSSVLEKLEVDTEGQSIAIQGQPRMRNARHVRKGEGMDQSWKAIKKPEKKVVKKVEKAKVDVYIPSVVSVGQLATLLGVRLGASFLSYDSFTRIHDNSTDVEFIWFCIENLQRTMRFAGMENESSYDYGKCYGLLLQFFCLTTDLPQC